MLAKYDADHDGRISLDEVKADPRLQKQFPEIDLDGDGFLNERDWDFYRARRASRNALLAVRARRPRRSDGTNIVWRMQKFLPNVPSPLLYQNVLYLVKDGGIVTSLDPKTGRILKQGRLTGALDTYYSSPVGGAGKVYMISQNGKAVGPEGRRGVGDPGGERSGRRVLRHAGDRGQQAVRPHPQHPVLLPGVV